MTAVSHKGQYRLHWTILGGVALLAALYWGYPALKNSLLFDGRMLEPLPGAECDWYLLLQMPEITTQYESGVHAMRNRLEEWMDALVTEGFRPMRLSEVRARLASGQKLPPRTVVLLFRSGSLKTYTVAAPILAGRNIPAVLLTNERAMQRHDRRYITFHEARKMKASGLWDVLYEDPKGRLRLESRLGRRFILGGRENRPWADHAGALALNRGVPEKGLQTLWVLSDWLAPELVNRLLVEAPVGRGPVDLVLGRIQNREWGITAPGVERIGGSRFDMAAPLNRRGIKHYWLATRGAPRYRLDVDVQSVVGEFWTQLDVDEAGRYSLDLIYSGGALVVREHHPEIYRTLYRASVGHPPGRGGFMARITRDDDFVTISCNGKPAVRLATKPRPRPEMGMAQAYITHAVRGTAKARGIWMRFTAQ